MKKLFLLLALLGIVATGCSKDEGGSEDNIPENIFFGLDKESVAISPDGGSVDVVVYSNYKWEISGANDWCTPSVKSGDANEDGQKVTFSADVAYDDREATFWFRCADKQIKFVVSQKSNNAIIYYTSSNGKIVTPYDSSSFGATILSNTYKDGVGAIEFDAPITTIGDYAFYQCSSITSVTIPNSVTEIEDGAFYGCDSLASVTIPDSVTSIGDWAFGYCSSLTSVTIPDSVTTIGGYAFYGCTGELIIYSKIIETDYTYNNYPSYDGWLMDARFTKLTIGDGVEKIGDMAFRGCSSLTSVTIPDSVTSIGDSAFLCCSSLQEFNGKFASADGRCLIIDGVLNSFAIGCGATEYTIPDSVTTIGESAFDDCSSLESVTIGDSVTTIGESAFDDCSSLESVTIGDSVTKIGNYAFFSCESLTSVTIPDSVTTIGNYAFSSCYSLTSITIPDSVTTIGNFTFYNCSSLREFNGKYASEDGRCLIIDGTLNSFAPAGLTEYTIPNSVTTIGNEAFRFCSSLTSVTIPDSVTTIGRYAFYRCDSLTSVYCKAVTPPAAILDDFGYWYAFEQNASGRKIYVPMESVEAYKSEWIWSEYASAIEGYNF